MDWYGTSTKRSSVSAGNPASSSGYSMLYLRPGGATHRYGVTNPMGGSVSAGADINSGYMSTEADASRLGEKSSYFFSLLPLNCADWVYLPETNDDCVALSSYKEDSTNKLQIVYGQAYGREATGDYPEGAYMDDDDDHSAAYNGYSPGANMDNEGVEGFDFMKAAEVATDYPITHLQWDPAMAHGGSCARRLGASLDVFRLYQVEQDDMNSGDGFSLRQTHILANATNGGSSSSGRSSNSGTSSAAANIDSNTFPPVTSFDWNKTDPTIVLTLSVDTTCTIWDLSRSHQLNSSMDTASVKTQLIAHDSEVFDVKFIHESVNIFASVGNDGSIRVFDLRSLEHSTIIYEPSPATVSAGVKPTSASYTPHHNSHALLKLSASNVDQYHLATIGVNSNQVIIIDMRMPGVPVANLDGSFDGLSSAAINSIDWHPTSNYLLTGGDDCQALVWDCNALPAGGASVAGGAQAGSGARSGASASECVLISTPMMAHQEDHEVNSVTWRENLGHWLGVVAGKGFQAVLM